MRFIGNLIWIIIGGIWLGLFWLIMGIVLCITLIGIPFGLQCFKAAKLTLFPFGKKVDLNFGKHPIANAIWAVLIGWEMALLFLATGIATCFTIIGIPIGIQVFKMSTLAFFPFGAKVYS